MANTNLIREPNLTNHTVTPSQESFFNGHVHHGANMKDPYVSGYAFIKWIKVPDWIGADNGAEFKQLTERNFKAFSGLSDIQLDTGAITAGFTNNELSFAKGTMQKAEGFTLKYQEQSGAPITKYYNEWTSGIRDPKTGIATYPKKHNVPYHSNNHTGILLYVVTRPDADNFGVGADKSNIEFACLFTHVMPTKIFLQHFNYESGSHEFAENEQEFKGYMNFGQAVEAFAAAQMSTSKVYKFYNENDFLNLSEYASSVPSA
jgi:hypothetical protein